MAVNWVETGLNAAIFAGILLTFGYFAVKWARPRVQMWIGGAIGNFMTNLAKQAAEEEGSPSSQSSSPGTINLGGFQISPEMIQLGMQLAEWAKKMGFLKGVGGSTGGGSGL